MQKTSLTGRVSIIDNLFGAGIGLNTQISTSSFGSAASLFILGGNAVSGDVTATEFVAIPELEFLNVDSVGLWECGVDVDVVHGLVHGNFEIQDFDTLQIGTLQAANRIVYFLDNDLSGGNDDVLRDGRANEAVDSITE